MIAIQIKQDIVPFGSAAQKCTSRKRGTIGKGTEEIRLSRTDGRYNRIKKVNKEVDEIEGRRRRNEEEGEGRERR